MDMLALWLLLLGAIFSSSIVIWRNSLPQWKLGYGIAQLVLLGAVLATSVLGPQIEGLYLVLESFLVVVWSMFGGSSMVVMAMDLARREGLHNQLATFPASLWIGVAERAAITLALCLEQGEFAAVVLGIKALGQYRKQNGHTSATRILGTMVSAIWALCCFSIVYVSRFQRIIP